VRKAIILTLNFCEFYLPNDDI